MGLHLDDTIAAIASAPGPAERGIVRLTGSAAQQIVSRTFRQSDDGQPWSSAARPRMTNGSFVAGGLPVPVAGALCWWPNDRSYTGQPVAELHLPGAPPVLDAVLEHLTDSGARLAQRGEFTLRAFLAGRIDLVQAEAVLGVIDATDHSELQQALSQLGGSITTRLKTVRDNLIALLGDLEAGLDFVEEDIQFIEPQEMSQRISTAATQIEDLLQTSDRRLPVDLQRRVVLAGLPNAGKSTLFNRIVQQERALVSPLAGTTRDYLSASIDLDGISVELVDTAGWEDALTEIEGKAQLMREEQTAASDLVIWCCAADVAAELRSVNDLLLQRVTATARAILRISTCCDRIPAAAKKPDHLSISALRGDNIQTLLSVVRDLLAENSESRDELLGTTAVRCRDSLARCAASLRAAADTVAAQMGDEITAMELRAALHELATVMGEVYTDDILDHIFSSFCIGK
jgi:tRNA modification GTPase